MTTDAAAPNLRIEVDPRILKIIGDPSAPRARLRERIAPPDSLPGALGTLGNVRHLVGYTREGAAYSERLHRRWGDIYRHTYGRDHVVWLWDLEEIQKILRNEDCAWSAAMGWDSLLFGRIDPADGNLGGLLSRDFEPHRAARRLLQPGFTSKAIKGYGELARPLIEAAVGAWIADGTVDFKRAARALLSDVANTLFTGIRDVAERQRIDTALRAVWSTSMAPFDNEWLSPALRRGRRQWRFLIDEFLRLVPTRRAAPGADMFSQLLAAHEGSDEAFVRSFLVIMLGAYDTTWAAVTSLTYLLAKHPAWQERLSAELHATPEPAQPHGSSFDWAWKESLRLMPISGSLPRRALREVDVLGHRLPAGCLIGLVSGPPGRSPENWNNPTVFDPERFAPERAEDKRRPGLFTPFGAGAHACIGMQLATLEARLLFQQLLTRCRFTLRKDYEARHTYSPLGIVSGDVSLRLERR